MTNLIFLKLGGSLITDKTRVEHARIPVIRRLAREVAAARAVCPELQLVLGHGSGSFGHVAAKKYGTRSGVKDQSGWQGFAAVAAAAARLNQIVTDIFVEEGVPVISLPPSASARCEDGQLIYLDTFGLRMALEQGLVPLVQGDVAFDVVRGATIISTEDVFIYLARELEPSQVLLAGEVAGVYGSADMTGHVIDRLTPNTVGQYITALGGSHGTDVTGGMIGKVQQMLHLIRHQPRVTVRIFSGAKPGAVRTLLIDPLYPQGTVIGHDD
ncbi:MAG TPA: isopentenyl phosphate kinase [Anaerolineae bacterium]|nr:isopentenyl phosphate kinase [Anaerolineae bacterium]